MSQGNVPQQRIVFKVDLFKQSLREMLPSAKHLSDIFVFCRYFIPHKDQVTKATKESTLRGEAGILKVQKLNVGYRLYVNCFNRISSRFSVEL